MSTKVIDFTDRHQHLVSGKQIKLGVKERISLLDRHKNALLDQLKPLIQDIDDAVVLITTLYLPQVTDPRTLLAKSLAQEAARLQNEIQELELSARNVDENLGYVLTPKDLKWYGL